ncbi:Uncharacterized MFS-type transporter ycaD [Serratia quinivorans]|uniref:Uncharacterized MFS-type transporter ycaD n=1 Tax=Serratia quinivorans TaxID=137545 RepID=A0A379YH74_9GAMM|nr:Uncharacterized MFS-type transporter ycaD [Serratia quinivorans]
MVSSSYFTGNLFGTLMAGKLIQRIGFTRSYHLACVVFAVATAGMALSLDFWSWMGWRFFAGIGCAWIWVIVESALLRSGNLTNRGQLLAAYMMVYYLGTVVGQLLLSMVSTELLNVVPWVTAIVISAMLPMLFARVNSQHDEPQHAAVWPMLKRRSARLGIKWLYYLRYCSRLVVWPDAAVFIPSGDERRQRRLLDGITGQFRHCRPVAGRAPG